MATWNKYFHIGNGEAVVIDDAPNVYRGYIQDCDYSEFTEEEFDEQIKEYTIYEETNLLSDVVFTPKTVIKQDLTDYYFCRFEMKIPRIEE